ncbi:MAG TPA: hypothetical protein VL995_21120 [Cellvibrio sp.]|nr:hypothetical protein [Cellvibrio sp.]
MESGNGLTQEFNGNVGQVAGGNIYNYYSDSKVIPAIRPELRRAVHELLVACDLFGQRKIIEKISLECFESSDFKSLEIEQLRWLIDIASEMSGSTNKAILDQQKSEAVDEEKFFKETGIRASAPARIALALLLKENLTKAQIARVWKRGLLTYEDDHQLYIHQRKFEKVYGSIVLLLGVALAIPGFFAVPVLETFFPGSIKELGTLKTLVFLSVPVGASLFFFWIGADTLAPHYFMTRVSRHVKKINDKLRELRR